MEKVVLIIDLRKDFRPFLSSAKFCIKTFIHEKLVHKPTCEFGFIGFGSVNVSDAMEQTTEANDGVKTISPFEEVSLNALRHVDRTPEIVCNGCLSSAFRKAYEMMSSGQKKKTAKKRVLVLSTFDGLPDSEQEACASSVAIGIADGVSCELVRCLDDRSNQQIDHWIDGLAAHQVVIRNVRNGYELQTCFPTKENKDAHVIYSGPLVLGGDVALDVKIVPKVKREGFPALGNTTGETYNESFSYNWSYPTTPVGKSDELFRENDIDQSTPIGLEDRVRGFKFGKSLLPLSNPLVEMAKVSTERGVRLLGFLDEGQVPVHLFMGTSKILFADKTKLNSIRALYSLASAMLSMKKVALLRVVLRAGSNTKLVIGFPGRGNPAYLTLKEAPFMEDIAFLNVIPLSESSGDVQEQARALVDANMLADSDMILDETSNPILHRAISYFNDRLLEIDTEQQQEQDTSWLEYVFGSHASFVIKSSNI